MKRYSNKEIHEIVIGIFAQALGVEQQSLSPLTAYNSHTGWDSLRQLEIVSNLEQALNINLTIDDMIEMDTIKKTEEVVTRRLSRQNNP